MSLISAHLGLLEFLRTEHSGLMGLQLQAPPEILINAHRFAMDLYEPCHDLVGSMIISSGYRCPELNALVGGSKTSAHMRGRAVDAVPSDLAMLEAFSRIAGSDLPFDQLIWEHNKWIHLGGAEHWREPRRQVLMKFSDGYEPFSDTDPRVLKVPHVLVELASH